MFPLDDTIAAVASAAGGAARGIVRVSGPAVGEIVARCFQPSDGELDLRNIRLPTAVAGRMMLNGEATSSAAGPSPSLPAELFLWPTTRSYTRQPLAEIHTLGSAPLLDGLLRNMCAAGARLAQPGEFTLRAFLAGRIDLTQAEAVLGVVDAADRRQLEVALEQLAGGLSQPLQELRNDLLNLLADLEAGLDFAEEDIRFVSGGELDRRLTSAAEQIDRLAARLSERGDSVGMPRVTLVGYPNVGKSSLFNALAADAAALVSSQPGTTRDYLTVRLDADGLMVELIDTAGIDAAAAHQPLDVAAQTAAAGQHGRANLRLLCLDVTRSTNDWERVELGRENTLPVLTKCDLAVHGALNRAAIATSSRTGDGLDQLRKAIHDALISQVHDGDYVGGTSVRIKESVRLVADAIARSRQLATSQAGEELLAAELRAALAELGKIVGAIYTDDLLDRIFSRFCLGK